MLKRLVLPTRDFLKIFDNNVERYVFGIGIQYGNVRT